MTATKKAADVTTSKVEVKKRKVDVQARDAEVQTEDSRYIDECARMIGVTGDVKILQRKVVLADGRNGPVPASAK
jgi:hypothetical protein